MAGKELEGFTKEKGFLDMAGEGLEAFLVGDDAAGAVAVGVSRLAAAVMAGGAAARTAAAGTLPGGGGTHAGEARGAKDAGPAAAGTPGGPVADRAADGNFSGTAACCATFGGLFGEAGGVAEAGSGLREGLPGADGEVAGAAEGDNVVEETFPVRIGEGAPKGGDAIDGVRARLGRA